MNVIKKMLLKVCDAWEAHLENAEMRKAEKRWKKEAEQEAKRQQS